MTRRTRCAQLHRTRTDPTRLRQRLSSTLAPQEDDGEEEMEDELQDETEEDFDGETTEPEY